MRTIKMFKLLPFIALVIALLIPALAALVRAQDKSACRVKVRIVNFNWANSSERVYDRLSTYQTEWWLKEGRKKFPGVCITTTSGEADYLLSWSENFETSNYTYQVPKTETTHHSGTINTTSSGTATSSSGTVYTSGSGSGTYSGTSTRTTYEDKQGEINTQYVVAYVHKLTDKVIEIDVNGRKENGKEAEKIPAFMSRHKGQWRWSKPDKDAFEKAIKFVAGQAK